MKTTQHLKNTLFLVCVGALLLPQIFLAAGQPAQTIEQLRISGHRRIPESTALYYVKSRAGQPFDPEQVFQDYWSLVGTRFFSNVAIHAAR